MNCKMLLLIVIMFGISWPALAHAILLDATPAADSVVDGTRISVRLRFNARIDTRRSRLALVNREGREYPLPIQDQRSPDTLATTAEDLSAGSYVIRWQVLATDGHITRGEISFRAR